MSPIIVSEGQSLLDVALWLGGGTEALFALADANGLAIGDALHAGQVLQVPAGLVVSADVVGYYQGQGLRLNTTNQVELVAEPAGLLDFSDPDFIDQDYN